MTPSEEDIFRLQHSRGRKRVHRNSYEVEIRFLGGHDAVVAGQHREIREGKRPTVSIALLEMLEITVFAGLMYSKRRAGPGKTTTRYDSVGITSRQ